MAMVAARSSDSAKPNRVSNHFCEKPALRMLPAFTNAVVPPTVPLMRKKTDELMRNGELVNVILVPQVVEMV